MTLPNRRLLILIGTIISATILIELLSCDDSATGCENGCDCLQLEALESPFPEEMRVFDSIQFRFTSHGFEFFRQNLNPMLQQFMPEGLVFEVLPTEVKVPEDCSVICLIDATVCEQTCQLQGEINDTQIVRTEPNILTITIWMDLSGIITITGRPECDVEVHIENKPVSVDIVFMVDPLNNALTYDISGVNVELQKEDLDIVGGFLCDIMDWDPIKGIIVDQLNNEISSEMDASISEQITEQTCLPCDHYPWGCPSGNGLTSHCGDAGYCMHDGNIDRCVAKPMGIEGKANPTELAEQFQTTDKNPLQIQIIAGQKNNTAQNPVIVDDGLEMRIFGGAISTAHPCIDPVPPPELTETEELRLGNYLILGDQAEPYMIAISVSDLFIDQYIWASYTSGLICTEISQQTTGGILSTGTLSLLVPSLNTLTGGVSSPVMLYIRPVNSPSIDIADGYIYHDPEDPEAPPKLLPCERLESDPTLCVDPDRSEMVPEPRILRLILRLRDFGIEFYGWIEERYVRLFTMVFDINIDIGLEVTPENQIFPVMSGITEGLEIKEITDSEMLAEQPEELVESLQQLIPIFIESALPMLGEVMQPIDIPQSEGFNVLIRWIRGEGQKTDTQYYDYLTVYGDLSYMPAEQITRAETHAVFKGVRYPAVEKILKSGLYPWIDLLWEGNSDEEYQFRINSGLWSPFTDRRRIRISTPIFMLQGEHKIEVRSRKKDDYRTLDPEPWEKKFIVDWAPPQIEASFDENSMSVKVDVFDVVTPESQIEIEYRLGDGNWQKIEGNNVIFLPPQSLPQDLHIRASDESGNTGYKTLFLHATSSEELPHRMEGCSCNIWQ